MMVFLWALWDAHHAALYPQCPPSAVPDPTILAALGPSTWISPPRFWPFGQTRAGPICDAGCPTDVIANQGWGSWMVPVSLMDPS